MPDVYEALRKRLRELRIASELTQEQFAEEAGFSYKYYQSLEAGRKPNLRLETLERLADGHNMEVWELLYEDTTTAKIAAEDTTTAKIAAGHKRKYSKRKYPKRKPSRVE